MMKLRIGDEVLLTAGKDKGRRGKIERIFPKEGLVLIPGLNIYKKHQKALRGQKGGVLEISRPLPFSNLALVCPKCAKPTRVGFQIDKTGEKARICRQCARLID